MTTPTLPSLTLLLAVCATPALAASDSDFDPDFGNSGYTRSFFDVTGDNRDYALALSQEPSGTYVVAGDVRSTSATGINVGIARISRSTGAQLSKYHVDAGFTSVRAVTTDFVGRTVVVGTSPNAADGRPDLAIVRFTGTSGNLDSNFSGDGLLSYDSSNTSNATDMPLAVVDRPDAGLYVLVEEVPANNVDHPYVIVSVSENGQTLSTLPLGGTTFGFNGGSMLLQPDGKLLVVVNVAISAGCLRPRLFRFAANTLVNLDTGFGSGGISTLLPPTGIPNCAPTITSIALDAQGRILLGGHSASLSAAAGWVARLSANGALDSSFSGDGWTQLDRPINGDFQYVFGVGAQSDGAVLAGGTFVHANASIGERPIVSRLTASGANDTSYGGNVSYRVYTAQVGTLTQQNAVAMLVDANKAVLAGITLATSPADYDYLIIRSAGPLLRNGFE